MWGEFGFSFLASWQGKGFSLCLGDVQVATRGKRALLKHAFCKEVQNKCDASMNIKRRRSPKAQVNFLFIGLCQQVGASVLGNGVGGHGTPWGCTGDTVLGTRLHR